MVDPDSEGYSQIAFLVVTTWFSGEVFYLVFPGFFSDSRVVRIA